LVHTFDEANHASSDEVFSVESARKTGHQSTGRDLDEITVVVDEIGASVRVLVDLKINPRALQLLLR
jgi:hypothetical protein